MTAVSGSLASNNTMMDKQAGTITSSLLQRKPGNPHHSQRPHRHSSEVMNEGDFLYLYEKVKNKPFKDDKLELLSVGVLSNQFTCRQCIKIMSIFTFDDDKLKALEIMSGHLVDRENHDKILEALTFSSSKDKAKNILDIPQRRF